MINNNSSQNKIAGTKTPIYLVVFLFIGLIVLIGIAVTIKVSNDKAAEQKAALEQKYVGDLNAVVAQMLTTGATAEKMNISIHQYLVTEYTRPYYRLRFIHCVRSLTRGFEKRF